MKRILLLILIAFTTLSCKSTKKTTSSKQQTPQTKVVANAKQYLGTRYKYGGTTHKGMDCSGLIYVAYQKEHITLPRVSRAMATKGKTINLAKAKKGDLVFFKTSRKNRINHVGMVTAVKNNIVYFIHASSSRGVVISSLNEKYYKKRFVKAKRIL